MRYSAEWMVLADDRILEYIRAQGSGRPKAMADSGLIRYSREYINQRCKKLVEEDFLDHLGNGVYVITELGEKYLDGEIDAETCERTSGIEAENGVEG
ncbi:MarR family transcriptional regulator [Halomicrobium salinisoli]|uniref:MarR family transcriptional regulator n=1 Tax=Halomicrobium salinisoli TaxID=2878391 RepID=UPI003B82DFD9